MQTSLPKEFLQTTEGLKANEILRSCVHCGLCNATCPTYQLTGNELDGPRGRIYLIKNHLEDQSDASVGLRHLDRCLTCLSCETTCPSNVRFGHLLDIGRKRMDQAIQRPLASRIKRHLIARVFAKPYLVRALLALARLSKPFLPRSLATKIPIRAPASRVLAAKAGSSRLLTIRGCVQSVVAPQINQAAAKVLERSGIGLEEAKGNCCGALSYHLADTAQAEKTIRQNIDNWYPELAGEYQYLVVASSGCSSFIKQYGEIMQADPRYAKRAAFISEHCRDLSELDFAQAAKPAKGACSVAFHSPCTLQHAQGVLGNIEGWLEGAGYRLIPTADPHLCCGSAGSYSLLEPELSTRLLENKLDSLEKSEPDIICTANIGCLMHLQSGTRRPVKHWIELLT